MNYPKLNIPTYAYKLRKNGEASEIWDIQRKKYVICTPEEWVRQHLIHYLIDHLTYPAGLIAIEKEIKVNRTKKRFDLVITGLNGSPWMLVECKAPQVELTQDVINQAGRYNSVLKAPYLAITNGMKIIMVKVDLMAGSFQFLKEFPKFGSEL